MAVIGTASVLAGIALAFSIYWAAALAPPNSAAAVWPFLVAFVGALVIAAVASYAVARQRGHTTMTPLVLVVVVIVAAFAGGSLGNVAGWLGLLLLPLGTIALWAYSAVAVHHLRALRTASKTG